nr:unnamed protein product [Callosobruchus chinensis]
MQLKTVYYALFQSQLNYGLVGWGGVRDCHLSVLEISLNWCKSFLSGRRYLICIYPSYGHKK